MIKILSITFLSLFILPKKAWCVSPNEKKIYFHLHQAMRWSEVHYINGKFYALEEARKHLGAIKFSELKLVQSVFYEDFEFLTKLTLAAEASSMNEVERFHSDLLVKAERHQIALPPEWEEEFFLE